MSSIKDHFKVIPKEKEKPPVKIHPLFIKKTPVKKEKTPPPPPVPTPRPVKHPPKPVVTFQRIQRKPQRPHALQGFIHTHANAFYQQQKKLRLDRDESTRMDVSDDIPQHYDVESFMNLHYPEWQQELCCHYLYNRFPIAAQNTPWCEKYRPNSIDGLVGCYSDFEFLKGWLEEIKVSTDKKRSDEIFNLTLLVGDHGTGKTATAYTIAKECGYSVFEINSSSRRSGKDVLNAVGEMTSSHLVRFDSSGQKRKATGERIIMRDTVKKKKTVDIMHHFKKIMTLAPEPKREEKIPVAIPVAIPVEEPKEAVVVMQDAPKQSLVLLEEVDLLFEDDKGFWSSVIELCQKSKRPIIMTCNDELQVPKHQLDIESTVYFEQPDKKSLFSFIQLVCFQEKCIVEPYDIEFICRLYHHDLRRILTTLEFWLKHTEKEYKAYPFLFAHIMGFDDIIGMKTSSPFLLGDRLVGMDQKTMNLCCAYYDDYCISSNGKVEEGDIETAYHFINDVAFADAYIGLTHKQRHQVYDIDQYNNNVDTIITGGSLLYKNAKNLDHWELGEIIENSILVMNSNKDSYCNSWRNLISACSSHLYNETKNQE